MGNPFGESPIPPSASMNRVLVRPSWPEPWDGSSAGSLLCRTAWMELVTRAFPDLAGASDPLLALEGLPERRDGAQKIVDELGRRLAALFQTLKLGTSQSRGEREEWNAGSWEFWASRETLILGGGLVSGWLGRAAVDAARQRLGTLLAIEISDWTRHLALVGAARSTKVDSGSVLALDQGGSALKRAVFRIENRSLLEARIFPPLPANPSLSGEEIIGLMRQGAAGLPADDMQVSINRYVLADGNPAPGGMMGRLRDMTDNVPAMLGEALGRSAPLAIHHDGTAAATAHAGRERTAVIMYGTDMGIGIPPFPASDFAAWDSKSCRYETADELNATAFERFK